jgi:hypothetical protein
MDEELRGCRSAAQLSGNNVGTGCCTTEADIVRWIRIFLPAINLVLTKTRQVFSGDPATTLKVKICLLPNFAIFQYQYFKRVILVCAPSLSNSQVLVCLFVCCGNENSAFPLACTRQLLQSQLSKANLQNAEYGSDKPRACGFVLGGSSTLVGGKSRLEDVTLEFCSPLCV